MNQKKQAVNPYLPLNVYIPDGEPHVFGDRLYLYGSHDREGGTEFCELDYEVFSAPITDPADWRSEGISWRSSQDPDYSRQYRKMYAPDVVRGNDGRYYLYYAMSGERFTGPVHAAVSGSPAGPFTYYGCVRNPDGSDFTKNITFDPGLINDNGIIRMYYGWSLNADPAVVKKTADLREQLIRTQAFLFEKPEEEIRNTPGGIMGAFTVELEEDMLTVKGDPVRILPGQFSAEGTGFENHAFFEASSIRKIKDTYYFIYSSQQSHELCYATSKWPDKGFVFGGVIISNGDIGFAGRTAENSTAMTGNNHGSIEQVNGSWYVFYHRQTHKTSFSRQGCAEKIELLSNGSIPQVEMTSCGLNGGPLQAEGTYSAAIACNLTNGPMPHVGREEIKELLPYVTHENGDHYITDISDGTEIGFKYFEFSEKTKLGLVMRGEASGVFQIYMNGEASGACQIGTVGELAGEIPVRGRKEWSLKETEITASGVKTLVLKYRGEGVVQLKDLSFTPHAGV